MRASLKQTRLLRSLIFTILAFGATLPAWSKSPDPAWVPGWYTSPGPTGKPDSMVSDLTIRQIVTVSLGGSLVRLRLSNAYGTKPLYFDDIRLARRLTGSRIEIASNTVATFQGHARVTIAPGAYALSDPLPLSVANDSDLAISLYVNTPVPFETAHDYQRNAVYITGGNATQSEAFPDIQLETPIGHACPWLAEIEVAAPQPAGAIVAFGDSITDGYGVTPDKGATWPEVLSRRLHEAGMNLSVVNAGISGNRLLHNGQRASFGDGALARFDRDVLAQPGVSHVIVLIGINDLGHVKDSAAPEYVSASDIIDGLSQLAERAHEKGIHIYAATLTPFKDTTFTDYYSDAKEAERLKVNVWIRNNKIFDGVIDFDKALEAPDAPGHIRPELDVGDHLHPNTAGAALMGNAVPLELFAKPEAKRKKVRHRK